MNKEKIYSFDMSVLENDLRIWKDILDSNDLEQLWIFVPQNFFLKLGSSWAKHISGIFFVNDWENILQLAKIDFPEMGFYVFRIDEWLYWDKQKIKTRQLFQIKLLKSRIRHLKKYKSYWILSWENIERSLKSQGFI